jgi:hypothetical protein
VGSEGLEGANSRSRFDSVALSARSPSIPTREDPFAAYSAILSAAHL